MMIFVEKAAFRAKMKAHYKGVHTAAMLLKNSAAYDEDDEDWQFARQQLSWSPQWLENIPINTLWNFIWFR